MLHISFTKERSGVGVKCALRVEMETENYEDRKPLSNYVNQESPEYYKF